ncbi:MAG: hypothetical protein K0S35_2208, partial [Geminicoccaceae bacterium]|nr:hypothetical protein [Geminicoccaceae bacterium]
ALKTRRDYLDQITALVRQDIVDLMLLSIANLERLVNEGVFRASRVGTAIRANDTTDIWGARHGVYKSHLSLPHRSALVEHAMHGRQGVAPGTPPALTDLGLYSITFMNDAELDRAAGERYREFRIEAERWGFKHFLEVFNPNVGSERLSRAEVGDFVNDNIVRVIAAVPEACRPQFLKIAYNGRKALEELVAYDPTIIVGILGGGAGTTRDTFELLAAAQQGGARLVLFGRKINLAENPLALVALMKRLVDGEIEPADAVRAYHDALAKSGGRPLRALEDDLEISEDVLR